MQIAVPGSNKYSTFKKADVIYLFRLSERYEGKQGRDSFRLPGSLHSFLLLSFKVNPGH